MMIFLAFYHPPLCRDSGDIVTDPGLKQLARSSACLTFVFSSRSDSQVYLFLNSLVVYFSLHTAYLPQDSPSIVSSYSEGRLSPAKLQECLSAAHLASQKIFQFYRSSLARKLSKET